MNKHKTYWSHADYPIVDSEYSTPICERCRVAMVRRDFLNEDEITGMLKTGNFPEYARPLFRNKAVHQCPICSRRDVDLFTQELQYKSKGVAI